MKLLPATTVKSWHGIHNEKFISTGPKKTLGSNNLLLNMNQLSGPVVSDRDEQETCLHKSISSNVFKFHYIETIKTTNSVTI